MIFASLFLLLLLHSTLLRLPFPLLSLFTFSFTTYPLLLSYPPFCFSPFSLLFLPRSKQCSPPTTTATTTTTTTTINISTNATTHVPPLSAIGRFSKASGLFFFSFFKDFSHHEFLVLDRYIPTSCCWGMGGSIQPLS